MSVTFTALQSSSVEHKKPQLHLIDDDGQHHHLRFHTGIVPAVVLALLNQTRNALPEGRRQREEQPLQVQSVTELAFEAGAVGLRLHLDGGLDLPLLLPPQMIGVLQKALSDIATAAAPRGPGTPTH